MKFISQGNLYILISVVNRAIQFYITIKRKYADVNSFFFRSVDQSK